MENRGDSDEQSSRHYTKRQYSDAKKRDPSWLYGKITRGYESADGNIQKDLTAC